MQGCTNAAGAGCAGAAGTTTQRGYDALGRLVEKTDEAGVTTRYGYDHRGALTQVSDALGQQTTYGYDEAGNKRSQTDANGHVTAWTYDALGRQTSRTLPEGQTETFQYDAAGNRISHSDFNNHVTRYSYDASDRQTHIGYPDGASDDIGYDAAGNRLAKTDNGDTTSYRYDANDRLLEESRVSATGTEIISYAYDANGNTIGRTGPNGTRTYRYDGANRLVGYDNGTDTTAYAYGPDGIRVEKTEQGVTTTVTHYLVDANRDYAQVLEERDGSGNHIAAYSYGDDLISQTRTTTGTRYYHYDGLGSTRQLSDEQGQVTDSYAYEAFGTVEGRSGASVNDYLFTGEQYDGGLDSYYLRARYYDPSSGRFTQRDTFGGFDQDPVTLHKYLYANADPINTRDPSGQFGLVELGVANDIASELISNQIDLGLNVLDRALSDETEVADSSFIGFAVIAGLGGGAKLGSLLSSKVRKCQNNGCFFSKKIVVGGGSSKGFPSHSEGTITLNVEIKDKPTVVGAGQNTPFKSGTFNEAIMEGLPYTELTEGMFLEMKRILGAGGKLSGYTGPGANLDEIRSALHAAGFQNIKVGYGIGNRSGVSLVEFSAEVL